MPPAGILNALLSHPEWFADPDRTAQDARPPILLIDNFYPDPDAVRRQALDYRFVSYVPPDRAIVGPLLAEEHAHRRGRWLSSALVAYHGRPAQFPFYGERFNPSWLKEKLEDAIGESITQQSWLEGGDHWNGAFHLVEQDYDVGEGFVHHHHKPGDLEGRGWSGVAYLSPDAPASAGTSIWRHRGTGRCVASFDDAYDRDPAHFELVWLAENRFNRAVLFRENVWHRLEHGFGHGKEARLTQTFFFEVGAG